MGDTVAVSPIFFAYTNTDEVSRKITLKAVSKSKNI